MDISDVHLRGTRAAQPAATTVAAGTLYYVTDETKLERASGTAGGYGVTWETYSNTAAGTGTVTTTGSPASPQVAVFSGASAITGAAVIPGSNGGGRALLFSQAASASATIDIVTRNAAGQSGAIFQSDFDEYEIEILNLVAGTNAVSFSLRVSTDGGSSYDSGANYGWCANRTSTAANGPAGSAGATSIDLTYGDTIKSGATEGGFCGFLRCFNPLGGAGFTRFLGEGSYHNSGTTAQLTGKLQGNYRLSTAVNAMRLLPSAGNFTTGTIRVYGVGKS